MHACHRLSAYLMTDIVEGLSWLHSLIALGMYYLAGSPFVGEEIKVWGWEGSQSWVQGHRAAGSGMLAPAPTS